jgi:hypothetical protein
LSEIVADHVGDQDCELESYKQREAERNLDDTVLARVEWELKK